MIRKIGLSIICLILTLSGNVFGEGDRSGTSKGSSGKAEGVQMMTFDKGTVTILNETGSIIFTDDDGLMIKMAGPKEARTNTGCRPEGQ